MAVTRTTDLDAAGSLDGGEAILISKLSDTETITAATISAQASDNSFNDSAAGFVAAGFATGDRVNVSGFTGDVANNLYVGTVTDLTASKMTIGGADGDVIVDDAEGESVTITKWLSERATAQQIADLGGGGGGARVATLVVVDPDTALSTGDGQLYYRVPSVLDGYSLSAIAATVITVSSSGDPSVQLHNLTDTVDMLSTNVTVDAGERDSKDAATPAVIKSDGSEIVAHGDLLRVDVDEAGTDTTGLIVELQFTAP